MAVTEWDAVRPTIGPGLAALGLISRLDEGNPLPIRGDPLDVDGEVVHVGVWLTASWYGTADVDYVEPTFLDFGGLFRLGISALASAVAHQRQRSRASALAAPQWRPLGDAPVRAVLTERRLVLLHSDGTVDLPLDDLDVAADLPMCRTELLRPDEAPLALDGPWVPYLTVALAHLMTGEVLPQAALSGGPAAVQRISRHP